MSFKSRVSWNQVGKIISIFPILTFLYLFFKITLNFDRSIDITDESFYLLSAEAHSQIKATVTQFGDYTGILYSIVSGDLYHFRLLSLFCLLFIAAIYAFIQEFTFARCLGFKDCFLNKTGRVCTILLATLCYYFWWLPTPSYNWLSLVACLLAYSGLLLTTSQSFSLTDVSPVWGRYHVLGALMFGVGVGLAFMAKPTTAVVLALIGILWILLTQLRRFAFLFALVACVSTVFFLCFHVLVFEAGFSSFVHKILNGRDQAHLLGEGHEIGFLLQRAVEDLKAIPFRIYLLGKLWWSLLPVVLIVIFKVPERFRIITKELATIAIFTFIWIGCWRAYFWNGGVKAGHHLGMGGVFLVFMVIIAVAIYSIRAIGNSNVSKLCFNEMFLVAFFVFLGAFAYAFGSGNGLMRQTSGAFVFFVSASIALTFFVYKLNPRSVVPQIFCCLVTISVLLVFQGAMSNPYRSAPIDEQTIKVTVGQDASPIFVDLKTSEYIEGLKGDAIKAGWIIGTPLIDLTGGSPGAAYILGARAPGTPWLLGGYPGSERFAKTALGYVDKESLDNAWVLTSPGGVRKISETILKELGVPFPEGYACVGEITSSTRREVQQLYKPTPRFHGLDER